MRLFSKTILIILCFILAFPLFCFADETNNIIDVQVDTDTNSITISGIFDDGCPYERVTLIVSKDGFSIDSLESPEGFTDSISDIKYAFSDKDGRFTFDSFEPSVKSGLLKITVSCYDAKAPLTAAVNLFSHEDFEIFRKVMINSSANEIYDYLNDDEIRRKMALSVHFYDLLDETSQKEVCSQIVKNRNNSISDNTSFKELCNFIDDLSIKQIVVFGKDTSLTVACFNCLKNTDNIYRDLVYSAINAGKYENTDIYSEFIGLSDSEKANVLNKVYLQKSSTIDEFFDKLTSCHVINEFHCASAWNDVFGFVKKYKAYLTDLNFDAYESCGSRADIDKSIIVNSSITSIDKLCKFINDEVKRLNEQDSKGSSSGGGSSKSSGGSSFSVPENTVSSNQGTFDGFTDIESVAWAKDYINYLAGKNIINGKGNNLFCPADNITREEFAKIVAAAFDLDGGENGSDFIDVNKGAWYEKYINILVQSGIMLGRDDGTFGVGIPITRQDVSVICYRIAQRYIDTDNVSETVFIDNDEIAPYAKTGVANLYSLGIISGDDVKKFNPTSFCTRAEAAKIIYLLIEKTLIG